MAVIIENMDMPESCQKCDLMYYHNGCCWCALDGIEDWVDYYKDGRHPNCPLREYKMEDYDDGR